MRKINKQKGETIVEVLLSIAIIGSAVGGAFAIANRSTSTVQANKERYQAQLTANGQADMLRAYTSNQTIVTPVTPTPFCMVSGVPVSASNPQCSVSYGGGATYVITTRQATDNLGNIVPNVYVISINWESLTNPNGDKVDLIYGV